jgi:hypothetical protein
VNTDAPSLAEIADALVVILADALIADLQGLNKSGADSSQTDLPRACPPGGTPVTTPSA